MTRTTVLRHPRQRNLERLEPICYRVYFLEW